MNSKNYLMRNVINKNTDQDDVFYLQALEATLEEWNSELDEKAFSDLQHIERVKKTR
jgi:hypothetical protein